MRGPKDFDNFNKALDIDRVSAGPAAVFLPNGAFILQEKMALAEKDGQIRPTGRFLEVSKEDEFAGETQLVSNPTTCRIHGYVIV